MPPIDQPGRARTAADAHPWRAAIGITLLGIVAEMALTIWILPAALQWGGWFIAGDAWPPITPAHFVSYGAFPYLYEGSKAFVAGPLLPLVLAPVAGLGNVLGLSESIPFPIPHPTLWLVYGPYAIGVSCVAFLWAVRRLATQAGIRNGRARLQLAETALVLVPAVGIWAHFEEPLALAATMLAVGEAHEGRLRRAAILVGVAIGFKQWAVLALPLLVAAAPPGRRVKTLAWGLAVPVVVFGLPLVLDWRWAAPAIFSARAFPRMGHAALWVASSVHHTVGTPFRSLAVACSVAVAWRIRERATLRVLLAALASVLMLRLVFEPVLYAYYLAPPLGVLVVYELVRTGRATRVILCGTVALLLFALHPHPVIWWTAEAALLVPIAAPVLAEALALPAVRRREMVSAP